jgi:hypothetical protein
MIGSFETLLVERVRKAPYGTRFLRLPCGFRAAHNRKKDEKCNGLIFMPFLKEKNIIGKAISGFVPLLAKERRLD